MKRLYCVRGATCCDNTEQSILREVGLLCGRLLDQNALSRADDIVSVQFTVTGDLDALNPATAFRRASLPVDVAAVPLFCAAEPYVRGGLERVVRVMVTFYAEEGFVPRAVYANGAERLRPDLCAQGTA